MGVEPTVKKKAFETSCIFRFKPAWFPQRLSCGFILPCAVALFLASGLTCGAQESLSWSDVFAEIEHKWPQVPQMSVEELQQRLELPDEQRPVVIDVRSREEFEVSHLAGVMWADSSRDITAIVCHLPSQQPIVLYCSVGIRSSEAAQKLLDSGSTHVFNLKGSIFQWANEGRAVVRSGKVVREVHGCAT